MSFYSRSSRGNNYKQGNYGSNNYQKKGILGNILNLLGSQGNYGGNYNNQPNNQQNNQPINLTNQPLANQGAIVCSKCTSQIPAGSKFCLQCGEPVKTELFCGGCGEKLPPNAKFCLNCGNKING